jgi:GNAT superfamily N-acetyltransferase
MEITEFAPDDEAAVRCYVEVANAVLAADSPWVHPLTLRGATGLLRHHWDGEPPMPFLATVDGAPVGLAEWQVGFYDNLHLAWLNVEVHPGHRRRGHGSALLDALVERTRSAGRTSLGIDGWQSAATRAFAARHKFELKSVEVNRRLLLADVDPMLVDRLYDDAVATAAAYELVRCSPRTPEDQLDAMATMVASINDAPLDDLDLEDEVFTADRVRAYEHAQAERGHLLHRLVARHRETGELAGQTAVAVDLERPHLAGQHDTSVVREHRGHRLGMLLKTGMLQWLREEQPQVASIDTWNAASNRFMIGVNEELGYRVLGTALAFQRTV